MSTFSLWWFTALTTLLTNLIRIDSFTFQANIPQACSTRINYIHHFTKSPQLFLAKSTLTDDTVWRVRLLLNDVTTSRGRKLDGQLFVIEGNFIEDEGYEPPQGTFRILGKASSQTVQEGEEGTTLELSKSRWVLSEDPNDRKDGLWIWGLFKEPLYPFMLLQIETKELKLLSSQKLDIKSGSSEGYDKDSIPPLKLYAKVTHFRKEDTGVELKPADLNVRVLERVQLPGASVDLFEEQRIGQISFQPL